MNFMFNTDGYKLDHRRQYPVGTEYVYSNLTPRTSRIDGQEQVVFFGLQYFLQKYMIEDAHRTFFDLPKDQVLAEYQEFVDAYLGPNDIGTDHIAALHDLGYMPLEFRGRQEGSLVNLRTPFFTVENTHPDFFWVTNYFETLLASVMWLPCTSATIAYRYRKLLDDAAEVQRGPKEFVPWQGHDFSMRGMENPEAAALSGAGHLLSFTGTDTIPAIKLLERYYDGEGLIGGSVAATEHSVMCAGGMETEQETYERLLNLYPAGILSVVSDTWDLWNVITNILPNLKDQILARPGKLVIRPDSGDPVKIIAGDRDAPVDTPARKGVVQLLWEIFGGTQTDAGYKILDEHVGVIYGDSITEERARDIIGRLDMKGFSAANMVFGIGSFTYQYNTRDTFGTAMKATAAVINGVEHHLYKDPITDNGIKKSATGRIAVNADGSMTDGLSYKEWEKADSLLQLVWRNGEFISKTNLEQVRVSLHG